MLPDVDKIICDAKEIDKIWNGRIAGSQLLPKKNLINSGPTKKRYIDNGMLMDPMNFIILLYFTAISCF